MGREIDVLAQPMRAKNRARSWLARTPCVNGTLNLTRVYRDRHFEPDPSAFCHVPACGDNVVRSYPLSFPSNCGVALAPDGGLVCRAILHTALPKLVVPHVFVINSGYSTPYNQNKRCALIDRKQSSKKVITRSCWPLAAVGPQRLA